MRTKNLCKFLSLGLTLVMALSCLAALFPVSAFAEEDKPIVIALDPGHGPQKTGTNGAVEYGGINEHFYTFSMATYAKERLEQFKGVEVHLTRTADNTPELMERPQTAANLKADAFVSIHINAANKKAGGTEIWVPNDSWRPEIAKASRAAGQPILAREEIEDYIQIPADCIRGRDTFALTVRGDSMINAGILDGDIIVVLRTPVAEDGEIVVALLGEEATVKRFYRDGRRIRLQPENDAYSPIYADEVKILGKVIALHRYEIR